MYLSLSQNHEYFKNDINAFFLYRDILIYSVKHHIVTDMPYLIVVTHVSVS